MEELLRLKPLKAMRFDRTSDDRFFFLQMSQSTLHSRFSRISPLKTSSRRCWTCILSDLLLSLIGKESAMDIRGSSWTGDFLPHAKHVLNVVSRVVAFWLTVLPQSVLSSFRSFRR